MAVAGCNIVVTVSVVVAAFFVVRVQQSLKADTDTIHVTTNQLVTFASIRSQLASFAQTCSVFPDGMQRVPIAHNHELIY